MSAHQRRDIRHPTVTGSATFGDAAALALLDRVGAARFAEAEEEVRHCRPPLPQTPQLQPAESLGRRLRNFLLRPRRRRLASGSTLTCPAEEGELQDYAYTRWVFHRRGSRERSASHDAIAGAATAAVPGVADDGAPADRTRAVLPASRGSLAGAGGGCTSAMPAVMTKSASARIVRFRCPYDSVSSSDQDSTLVSPYLTSAFPCLLPLPPGGSVSSGYSSDRDTPPEGAAPTSAASAAAAAASAHWVTREEDIDCLLLRRPAANTASAASAGADSIDGLDLPDDLPEVGQLDVPAFFFGHGGPAGPPPEHQQQQQHQHRHIYDPVADEIDRLVSDVVRMGGGGGSGGGSTSSDHPQPQRRSWGSWQQHQRPRRQPGWQHQLKHQYYQLSFPSTVPAHHPVRATLGRQPQQET